jgi:Transposase DDE domain
VSDTRLSMHAAGRDICLRRLSEVLPPGCRVSILADRGFGDHKLFAYLADLGFAYVIRLRGNIHVTDASGETRTAANWVGRSGRARKLHGARVTASHAYQVGAVVCVHLRDMKEPWCLAASARCDALPARQYLGDFRSRKEPTGDTAHGYRLRELCWEMHNADGNRQRCRAGVACDTLD